MTVHKLSAGDGYTYLTRHIAGGDVDRDRTQDAAGYYTAEGNPPGVWLGRGAPLLGLDGQRVTEEQMRTLFGHGMHPNAAAIIAAYQAAHIRAGMSDKQLARIAVEARRTASLGRAFPTYAALDPFDERVGERLATITKETGRPPTQAEVKKVRREEASRGRGGVAGYDLVFAPVKSAALLWALDPRDHVRQAVWDAHQDAKASALAMLEQHAAFTRVGAGGLAQVDTLGLVAVAFDHYDSRDGDPNLHTHVAIANKVCGTDGVWRSLDGRAVYRIAVAASEHYNTAFQTALTARLGVAWTARTVPGKSEPIHEIDGIPTVLIGHYSRRRNRLYAHYEQLIAEYRREHGQDPTAAMCHKLARQATLDTRQGKKAPRSLTAMRAAWTRELTAAFGPDATATVMAAVPSTTTTDQDAAVVVVSDTDVTAMATTVLAAVAEQRATWTQWNVHAEAERLVRADGHASDPQAHRDLVARVVIAALGPGMSIGVEAPSLVDEPAVLRRGDGVSVFVQHRADRYTSQHVLDAEQRLVDAARTTTAHGLPADSVTAVLRQFDERAGHGLDAGQRDLVTAFATTDAMIAVGIGAAGTGKTTAMRAYLHTAHAHGQRVIPLATSAASAAVLAADLGVAAENLHKFLHEHLRGEHVEALRRGAAEADDDTAGAAPMPAPVAQFALRRGDVILVDEAGMAGTFNLDRLRAIAAHHGAVIRLLGDYRQLGAVESGGVLRLIATDVGATELQTVHRFADPAEAAATVKLRVGDTSALDFYEQQNRIAGGSRHAMLDAVYTGWHTDITAGNLAIMCAATTTDVTALAARARLDRVALGHVEQPGVGLHDGNVAGRGDWIVTRRNKRRLIANGGKDFVRNGDGWTVSARHKDGSLTVRHLRHRGTVRLPADYVAAHVELLYATTVHRAQGDTVDTTHALVTADVSRENLYVAATRARHHTRLYTVTHDLLDLDEDRRLDRTRYDPDTRAAREVLETILAADTAEFTATETIRDSQHQAASLATLMPRMIHAAELAAAPHYQHLTEQMFGPATAGRLLHDPAWPTVTHTLISAEQQGWQPEQLLAAAARYGTLDDARSAAKLLAWRLSDIVDHRPVPALLTPPDQAHAKRYADLIEAHTATRPRVGALLGTPPALRNNTESRPTDDGHVAVDIAQLDRYANAVAHATGTRPVDVAAHHAWPRLAATITAWHRANHDPAALLTHANTAGVDLDRFADAARDHATTHGIPAASVPVPAALRHHQAVTDTLGPELADTVRAQPGWNALHAAIARAHHAGHDTRHVLDTVARARRLDGAHTAAQVLAWRLNRYLFTQSAPANPGRDTGMWATIGWTLAAHHHAGGNPEALLTTAPANATVHDLAAHITEQAQLAAQVRRDTRGVPPWTPPVRDEDTAGTKPYRQYLADSETEIRNRTAHLAVDAAAHQPPWTTAFGEPPDDADRRAQWLHNLGIVAAYRDQHHITDDDPRHPLGPYIEPGHAGHRAYCHAAHAIVNAHHTTTASAPPPGADALHRVAVDTYLALPHRERQRIAATIVGRLGALWHGDITDPDDAIIQHTYASHLHRALREHRHLAEPTSATPPHEPSTPPPGPRRPDPAHRKRPTQRRTTDTPRTPGTRRRDPQPRQQPVPRQPPRVISPPDHPNQARPRGPRL
ncbi:MAG TPA: MobF family relaxase [Micromonosporaceae bacterium]|nr:MobF family relaxase [Micromonosporaceae bacterium]